MQGEGTVMSYDSRFDEAVDELDSWRQWRPKTEEGSPNPLVIIVDDWRLDVQSDYGPFDILRGTDKHGSKWSVNAASNILKKSLVDGIVEEWDDTTKSFAVTETLGRVKPGELVAISYEGEGQGAKFNYSKYKIVRKPAAPADGSAAPTGDMPDSEIPF